MKPLIGITVMPESREKGRVFNIINQSYKDAILKAGGVPVLIPLNEPEYASDYLDPLDGILFSGGEDIHPIFYGESPLMKLGTISPERDRWEFELYRLAFEKKIPILGICRGCQLITAAAGGRLYQDIDTQVNFVAGHHPIGISGDEIYHFVDIADSTHLHKILKKDNIGVNSFHHQSVKELAPDFKMGAISKDGIIEAFEYYDMEERYIMGVQWHPEAMVTRHEIFLGLFRDFIKACKKR